MTAARWEHALYGVLLAICAWFARAYFPTRPADAEALTSGLAGGAILFGLLAAYPGPTLRRWQIWLLRVGVAPLLLYVLLSLLFMAASSVALLFVVSAGATAALVAAHVGAAALLAAAAWRRRISGRAARLIVALTLVADALLNMPLCAWLWAAPDAPTCEAPVRPGVVDRLTPQALTDGLSQPYTLLWIPERQLLAASFKMAGNLTVWAWDDPAANQLVFLDRTSDGAISEPVIVPRPQPVLPQYMVYDPARDELVVSRLGYDQHLIELVSLEAFPDVRVRRVEEVGFAAHAVLHDRERDLVVAFSHFREVELLDWKTFASRDRFYIDSSLFDPGMLITHAVAVPGTSQALISTFGRKLLELDWRTWRLRSAEVGFGAGELTFVPETRRVVQADMVFGALNVVDQPSMHPVRRLPLDYKPRSVAADAARDLLMVADWLGGQVRFYRLGSLEPVGEPVPVGPYVRTLAYDPVRADLYAASKCGVYRVDVEAALNP